MNESKCVNCGGELGDGLHATLMLVPVCEACADLLEVAQDRILAGEYGPSAMESMFCSDTSSFKRKQEAIKKMGWDRANQLMNEAVDKVRGRNEQTE